MNKVSCVTDVGEYTMPVFLKIFHSMAYLAIGIFLLGMIYILYLFLMPFKTPDIEVPMPLTEDSRVVERGDDITFIINYTKYQDASVVGTRTIQCDDGNLVTLTEMRTNLPKGKNSTLSVPVIIPEKTSLGMCKLVIDVEYEISPFKHVHQIYETEKFEVIE